MDKSELIKSLLNEIINELQKNYTITKKESSEKTDLPDFTKKNILILITGGDKKMADVKAEIDKISQQHNISIVFSDAFREIYSEEYIEKNYGKHKILDSKLIETKAMVADYDAVIIPVLTRNTCGKIVNGVCDTVITNLITFALITEKRIIACEESLILGDNMKYATFVNENMMKIKQLGIEMIKIYDLYNSLNEEVNHQKLLEKKIIKRVITESDIKIQEENSILQIKKGTIITDLARDKIKEKRIEVIFV